MSDLRSEPDVSRAIESAKAAARADNLLGRDCSDWIRVLHALGLSHDEITAVLDGK